MRSLYAIFLITGLVPSACTAPPESRSALSERGETAYDKRLVGVWYGGAADLAFQLIIEPDGDGSLVVIGVGVAREVGWVKATAHASEVDGRIYYNVRRVSGEGDDYTAEGETPGFIFIRVEFPADDTLFLHFMNGALLKDLIGRGRVTGSKASCGDYCSYLVLDLSKAELAALTKEHTPEVLFPVAVGPFRRLEPTWETAHWEKTGDSWRKAMEGD